MRRQLLIFLKIVVLLMSANAAFSQSQGSAVITKPELVEMFENISRDTKWDMREPMLWGYFFTDSSKERLEKVAPLLEQQGYRFVEIFLSDKETESEPDLWWLHIEKVEVHTPDSLDQRNIFFYKFAKDHKVGTYDGMDVGPANAVH